jgi:hypothetical protein
MYKFDLHTIQLETLVAEHSKQFVSVHGPRGVEGTTIVCEGIGSEHNVPLISTFGVRQSMQLVVLHLEQSGYMPEQVAQADPDK